MATSQTPQSPEPGRLSVADLNASSGDGVARAKEAIIKRRTLARQTITDMERLYSAWRENTLVGKTNVGSPAPLQVTLNEDQIGALTREFRRLDYSVNDLERAARDHEMLSAENPPQMAMGAEMRPSRA